MTRVGKNLGRHYKSQGPNSSQALGASAQVEEGVLDAPCALVPLRELLPERRLPGGGRSAPATRWLCLSLARRAPSALPRLGIHPASRSPILSPLCLHLLWRSLWSALPEPSPV